MKAIGDRMKENYEDRQRYYLTRRTPVIVRVDGKAFHTFTAKMDKPFDYKFIASMVNAAKFTAAKMQGFKLAYVQSDEASFLLSDYTSFETEAWFDYNKSKVESVTAATMTAAFIREYYTMTDTSINAVTTLPVFDARAFNLPEAEVANYFRWRALDWERNSLSMYARAFFSQKALQGAARAKMHEMLHTVGKNWVNDLSAQARNGTYIMKPDIIRTCVTPTYEDIAALLAALEATHA